MHIAAIETHYAGHRFRSRLEARWAVFFNALNITWQYEPQGYTVGRDKHPYLPDFWLPDLKAFVEVKGDPDTLNLNTLADLTEATAGDALAVLILGQIPTLSSGAIPTHTMLSPAFDVRQNTRPATDTIVKAFNAIDTLDDQAQQAIKELRAHDKRLTVVSQRFVFVTGTTSAVWMPISQPRAWISPAQALAPEAVWPVLPLPKVAAAYEAARTSRFEHGESGPTPA